MLHLCLQHLIFPFTSHFDHNFERWQRGLHTCQGVVWVLQLHTLNLGSQVNFDVDALGARRGVEETRRYFWGDVGLLTAKAKVVQDLLWILLIQVQKFWHAGGKTTTIKDTLLMCSSDSLPNHWFSCCCFTSPEVLHVLMTIVHHSCKVPRHGVAAFSRACGVHTSTLLLELAPFGLGCDFIAEERRQWPACDQPKTERDGNISEDILTHWPLFVCCCSGGDWL